MHSTQAKASEPNPNSPVASAGLSQGAQHALDNETAHDGHENADGGWGTQLFRIPDAPLLQRKCTACAETGQLCANCAEEQQYATLRRKSSGPSVTTGFVPGLGAGQPLEPVTRAFFEPRFGADFSSVRVHTGASAAESAKSINAQAYTLGSDVVFGAGQYQPQQDDGRKLLAHELAHTLQQSHAPFAKLIQRKTHPPKRTDCDALDDYIRLVVVNQETPQTVTAFWENSGTSGPVPCSTGKGKCCIDPGADDNIVGAQQLGSQADQSRWTPIGVRSVNSITNLGAKDMRRYWTEFVPYPRSIALHAYTPVDGTPLSHGCVRMDVDMAKTIYCGSIVGKTQVEVRGFARPRCDNSNLQQEWADDNISPIPKCTLRSNLDPELERLQRVQPNNAALLDKTVTDAFRLKLGKAKTVAEATDAAKTTGADLWKKSHGSTQGASITVDDRPLYWTRNFIIRELQEWHPVFSVSGAQKTSIINTFEMSSRGLDITSFKTTPPGSKRILITGFDPFGMDGGGGRAGAMGGLDVGNPSGAIVLAMDGQTLSGKHCSAQLQGAIFPVRYADFDQGVVENYVRNFLSGGNAVDMIMTISRNRDDGIYELEKYAARARGGHTDNAGKSSSQKELEQSLKRIHPGSAHNDEFRESTLPRPGMVSGSTVVSDDSYSGHLPDGTHVDAANNASPPANAISDAGSGGDFLSNEIFYRVSLLQLNQGTQIPMGHLHVPAGTQAEYQQIVTTVRQTIIRALDNSLCPAPAPSSTTTAPS